MTSAFDLQGLAIEQAATLAATFAVAALSYILIERPAAALGCQLEPTGCGGRPKLLADTKII